MKVLVDTNVLLDVLNNRTENLESSFAVWKLCRSGKLQGYISALSIANNVYILRKEPDPEKNRKFSLHYNKYIFGCEFEIV